MEQISAVVHAIQPIRDIDEGPEISAPEQVPHQVACPEDSPLAHQTPSPAPEQVPSQPLGQGLGQGDTPEPEQMTHQTPSAAKAVLSPEYLKQKVIDSCPDLDCDSLFISSCQVTLNTTEPPMIYFANRSWSVNYPLLSFLMNGQLYADYAKITGMLGLKNVHSLFIMYLAILSQASNQAVRSSGRIH